MIYEYKDDKTGKTIERDFPMTGEIPSKVVENGVTYYRVWCTTVQIPEYFHDGLDFNSGKSPSGKKHFW